MSGQDWASPGGDDARDDDGTRPPEPPRGAVPPPPPPPPPPPGGAPPPPVPPAWRDAPPPVADPGPVAGRAPATGRRIPVRPLRLGEVLDVAFRMVRADALPLALMTLVTIGLLGIVQQLALPSVLFDPAAAELLAPEDLLGELAAGSAVALVVGLVLSLVVQPVVVGAIQWFGLQRDRGEDPGWQGALRWGVGRLGALVGTALLTGLVLLLVVVVAIVVAVVGIGIGAQVGTGVAVVAGLVLVPAVALVGLATYSLVYIAPAVVVVEGAGPGRALSRSVALVRPQLLRVTGVVVVAGIVIAVISGVAGFAAAPVTFVSARAGLVAGAVVGALVQALVVPFSAFVALLVYVDARVRLEGWDVDALLGPR